MKNNYDKIVLVVLLMVVISAIGFFILDKPTITGFISYEDITSIANWTFDDESDYNYNTSLMEIENGNAKLVSTTSYTYWNTSTETDYQITLALHNPSDKTDKVDSIDNKKHEIEEDELFEVFFSNNLDNGDIITFDLKDADETTIYLCGLGTTCTTQNYGSVAVDDEGQYNVTLTNLQAPTKIINIITQEEIKIDHITSTKGDIEKALYDPKDKTDKVQAKDSDKQDVKKDKLFNLIFDNNIANQDIISLYLKDGDPANIHLCDYGEDCSSPGYGLVSFDGNEGWVNLTVTGLPASKSIFNLNPDEKLKLDYIKAVNLITTEHSSTNTSYPSSASIETEDLNIISLSSFLNFNKNNLLNNQNIAYFYSIDSGNNWNNIPDDGNISSIDTENNKIRIKAETSTNSIETPIIYDFAVSYSTKICNENWNLTYSACLSNDERLKYYLDKNECGTTTSLPADNSTYESCDYCNPNWTCIDHGSCLLTNNKVCNDVIDNNNCFNATGLDSDKYVGDYNEFSQACSYSKIGVDYQNLSISLVANEKTIINATNSTDTILELVTGKNTNDKLISITQHNQNLKNTSPEATALDKYLDIIADSDISENITSVKIKIYYNDEEVNNAGLDENTLKIHYFNETSSKWQLLNSTVNASGNYVEVTINHLSTFGIFGDKKAAPSSSSGSSGSSGGGGGGRTIRKPKIAEEAEQAETLPEEVVQERGLVAPEEKACEYKISIAMPEHVSFVESDFFNGIVYNVGNCEIENLDIAVDSNLDEILRIDTENTKNIGINDSAEFLLIKKLENSKSNLLIQGFNIKIAEENIETYDGVLTFNALVNNKLAFEEKISIKVDIVASSLTLKSKSSIFSLAFLLLIVLFFVFYRKSRKKEGSKTLSIKNKLSGKTHDSKNTPLPAKTEVSKEHHESIIKELLEDLLHIKAKSEAKVVPEKPHKLLSIEPKESPIEHILHRARDILLHTSKDKPTKRKHHTISRRYHTPNKKGLISKLKEKMNEGTKMKHKPKKELKKTFYTEIMGIKSKKPKEKQPIVSKKPEPKYIIPKSGSHTKRSVIKHLREVHKHD